MVPGYSIEACKDEHLDDLVELIKKFDKESLSEYGMDLSENALADMFYNCKKNGLTLVVNGKCKGVIAGISTPSTVGDELVWQEVVWYVDEPYRKYGIKLYKAMEEKLRNQGVTRMVMALMHNSKKEKIDKFYKKIGYVPMETQYLLNLKEK